MTADQEYPKEHVENVNEALSEAQDSSLETAPVNGEEENISQNKKVNREPSPAFAAFVKELEQKEAAEDKIRAAIDFMKQSLVNPQTPRFRDFWDARRFCLPLFKEQMGAKARGDLWQEYVDLSTEAKRLKEILDEQSAFAFEQIDLAIQALAKDIENYETMLAQVELVEIPSLCSTMQPHKQEYQTLQSNLQLLNGFASKINSLRKEVIHTEMRIKNKNKLFEKLSAAGDNVFPKRKQLIKQISELFSSDVAAFVENHFAGEQEAPGPLHHFREEIKALQIVAKDLTLNAQSFNDTRLKLSECWDKLKVLDKERKKEISQKKQQMRQNVEQVMEKIKAFEEFCKNLPAFSEASKQFEEVLSFMKTIELTYPEQKMLKDELFKARKPVWDKQREEQTERENKEKEATAQKRQKIESFRTSLESLVSSQETVTIEELMQSKEQLHKEYAELSMGKAEKMVIDRLFKQLKDAIDEKKSKNLLSLPESDKARLEELLALLEERKVRRQEIKSQIEAYRKILGGSGFDFEKAMMYRELIEAEKLSLEKINQAIEEIEEKVSEIEG